MDCQEYFVDLEMSLAGVATALEVSAPGQLRDEQVGTYRELEQNLTGYPRCQAAGETVGPSDGREDQRLDGDRSPEGKRLLETRPGGGATQGQTGRLLLLREA